MPLPKFLEKLARDCEITAYRSSGPGGQKKNKTESSVRVRHLPTGLVRVGTESRSQTRNRELAYARLRARIESALHEPKRRRPTKPSRSSQRRRLQAKKQRGDLKRSRGRPRADD